MEGFIEACSVVEGEGLSWLSLRRADGGMDDGLVVDEEKLEPFP